MSVEAITLDEKNGQADKYDLAAQYAQGVQNSMPAGLVEAPKQLQCASVSEISRDNIGDNKPPSIEVATEPASGRLSAISNTDSKEKVAEVDHKKQDAIDPSMRRDSDGDGLVDGLDNKNETRAEIAKKLSERQRLQSFLHSLTQKASVKSVLSAKNVISDADAKNSGILGINKGKGKGPGDIDLSGTDPDKNDKVGGVLAKNLDS
jgi:hypothetical protein